MGLFDGLRAWLTGGVSLDSEVFENNAQGRNRTTDTRIFSPLLYRLSYLGLSNFFR
jgi:hypothetical protein